jgi:hypothetical protein
MGDRHLILISVLRLFGAILTSRAVGCLQRASDEISARRIANWISPKRGVLSKGKETRGEKNEEQNEETEKNKVELWQCRNVAILADC